MYHTYDHIRIITRRRCSFALTLHEIFLCWNALKCEFDMFLQKAFTAHGKLHCVYNCEQYITYSFYLALYCNGRDSSCQVSLFSHVHDPWSLRWRANPVIWREMLFGISLHVTLHGHIFITPSLDVAKNY